MAYKYLRTEDWTSSKFFKVKDCPVQRQTDARIAKAAKHLSPYQPVHDRVAVAYRKGKVLCKVDGHTRQACELAGLIEGVPADRRFRVEIYDCPTDADVEKLYRTFDAAGAAETSGDRSYSLIRKTLGFAPASGSLLNKKVAFEIIASDDPGKPRSVPDSQLLAGMPGVKAFADAIHIIDEAEPKMDPKVFRNTWMQTALIISVIRDGEKALKFWRDVQDDDAGTLTKTTACAVQMIRHHASAVRLVGGKNSPIKAPRDCVGMAIGRDGNAQMLEYALAYYTAYQTGEVFEKPNVPQWEIRFKKRRTTPLPVLKFMGDNDALKQIVKSVKKVGGILEKRKAAKA